MVKSQTFSRLFGYACRAAVLLCATVAPLEAAVYSDLILESNPRGYWRLGEPAGSTVAVNSATTGPALDGSYTVPGPTPELGVPGIPALDDSAALFSGGRQVRMPDPADPTAYTLEAWIQADSGATTSRNIVVRTSDSGPGTHWSHQLRIEGGGLLQHYTYAGGGRYVTGTTTVQPDRWYHVVGTYQPGSPGGMELFVNGVREGVATQNFPNPWTGGNQWRIGSSSSGMNAFSGTIDEVAVYPSVLDSQTIARHYIAGSYTGPERMPTRLVNLADVVGGGNGFGTGTPGTGINPATGALTTGETGQITDPATGADRYHPVTALAYVDGVFIPAQGGGAQTITSTGLTAGFPATDGNSWDFIRNGANRGSGSVLDGIDYAAANNSMIGLHANKGITFDLDAMRAAHPDYEIGQFQAIVGNATNSQAQWQVYVDGALKYDRTVSGAAAAGYDVNVALSGSDRFVTLVGLDGGDGYSDDQIVFGNPRLELGDNIALGKPVTASAYYAGAGGFPGSSVTSGELNDSDSPNRSFWLAPDATEGAHLTIDLLDHYRIDRIDLQNTHNRHHNDRGTADFTIEVSIDDQVWTPLFSDTLESVWGTGNNIPIESFKFDPTFARFVRFTADSFYGAGAGLNEIRIYNVPEPGSLLLLVLGALPMVLLKRRRR